MRRSLALLGIVLLAVGAARAETVTRGGPAWSWETYQDKLQPIHAIYPEFAIELNSRRELWGLQIDPGKLTFQTFTKQAPATPSLEGTVTYGSAINIDADVDFEIFQCGWKFRKPSQGHFIVADFQRGKLQSVTKYPIQGCTNVWGLKRPGAKPMIALTGEDEGKLGDPKFPFRHAKAPLLIYDPVAKKLRDPGVMMSSHESVVVDLDGDGKDDILACNWDEPADSKITFLRNTGTTLELKPLSPMLDCMALEVLDLKHDGKNTC